VKVKEVIIVVCPYQTHVDRGVHLHVIRDGSGGIKILLILHTEFIYI